MIDLIAHGVPLGTRDGKEWVEIPSASFVAKCEETRQGWDAAGGPLPPS